MSVSKKTLKRVVPLAAGLYWLPWILLAYIGCGLLDVLRNTRRTLSTVDRYFAGNGVFTWLLAPFNLLTDLLCLPFRNKGVYQLTDLPEEYQKEIKEVIAAAHNRDLIGALEAKLGDKKRGMIFFKWYGKNIPASVDMPEYHKKYRFIRTIGVSIFNKKQSTGKHYGPLRVTLRVLYNINTIDDPNVYIRVGNHTHVWRENKLFIFDDTLQHKSCNESDAVRYCLFVDILRPSLIPSVMSGLLAGVRMLMAPFRAVFYQNWSFIR